jgi:replicative DNA helicase
MYEGSLGRFNEEADAEIRDKYKTLKTYYRKNGDFDLDTLDREIIKAHKDSDLIILDHLHYVDLDSKSNENSEMSKLLKKLRHLTLVLGIPIICIAHLKKGSAKTLVPELDDFHGSSEITKIATTCLMLAPCRNFTATDLGYEGGLPTFMRIAKFRLGGERTGTVGMAFYDRNTGNYLDKYAVGRLNFSETKWTPNTDRPPYWAKRNHLISDISEVE